ncbi:hypothetical protein DN402_22330 [Streptomyces sp. SW4]|nr:hypothetical protein DN402_22330 [Streptomyces sp. SW4]
MTTARAVPAGPYVYIPAPKHSVGTVRGALTKDGRLITLMETESILRDFLNVMGELQAEAARRWGETHSWSAFSRAE